MAKIKPERAAAKEEITSFVGIGGHASPKGHTAGDCCNFRICGDGSLEKRSGWSVKREFNNPVCLESQTGQELRCYWICQWEGHCCPQGKQL